MQLSTQIAKHFKEVFFGGNWTSVNMRNVLADVTWQQANMQVHRLNTIATLVFHINYYVSAALKVLQGKALDASDKLSFNLAPIQSEDDWQALLKKVWTDAEHFANVLQQLPDTKLWETFSDEKYGNYYRNIYGIIEHTHYHLGQMVLIKKIVIDIN